MGWSWKKELIQIPSIRHLKYDRFKQNVKQDNFIEHTLKAYIYAVVLQRYMKVNL